MRRICLSIAAVALLCSLAATAQRGIWPAEITFFQMGDPSEALPQASLDGDTVLFGGSGVPGEYFQGLVDLGLRTASSYGTSVRIQLNPALDASGKPLFRDGRLNPFGIPEVRQAMSYLIDREAMVQELFSGHAVARWTVLNPFSPAYAEIKGACHDIERAYAHDEQRAWGLVEQAMYAVDAYYDADGWWHNGALVTMVGLFPEEGVLADVGGEFVDLLSRMGFRTTALRVPSPEAASLIAASDPREGEWSFRISQAADASFIRDQAGAFSELFNAKGMSPPAVEAYAQALESFPDAAYSFDALARGDYASVDERAWLLGDAEWVASELAWYQWVCARETLWAWPENVALLVDHGGNIADWSLWAHSVRFVNELGEAVPGGTLRVACSDLLEEPWNPVDGSQASSDTMIQRATEDWFLYPDPETGGFLPHLVQRAECYVLEGTPMTASLDWVTVIEVDEIEVPNGAWVDWDAANEAFVTVGDEFPRGLTARTKTVCVFDDALFENLWHDGSRFSIGDMLMHLIMLFDPAKPESPIYDPSRVPALERLMQSFKGARITSIEPLTIEVYDDRFCGDAERHVFERIGDLFWPYYGSGMAPWHAIAVGWRAEAKGRAAFSAAKAEALGISCQNWIFGQELERLASEVEEAQWSGFVPYADAMNAFEVAAGDRYDNLRSFLDECGHLWIGNGPMRIAEIDPEERTVTGVPFAGFRHTTGEFALGSPELSPYVPPCTPADNWAWPYDGAYYFNARCLQATSDGYLLFGDGRESDGDDSDMWLVQTDATGREVWHQQFGGQEREWGYFAQQTDDGGYILVGESWSPGVASGGDVWLRKLFPGGVLDWEKRFPGSDYGTAYAVLQTDDGGYLLAGRASGDIWLMKTSRFGAEVWRKTYDGGGSDGFSSLLETGGDFVVLGYTTLAQGELPWLFKVDSRGNMRWQKTYGEAGWGVLRGIVQTSDGGFVLTGETASYRRPGDTDVWLVKTAADGFCEWERTFGDELDDRGRSVAQTDDGGYVVLAETDAATGSRGDMWLIKADRYGRLEWQLPLGRQSQGLEPGGPWLQLTADGACVILGGTGYETWLMRRCLDPPQ